MDTTERNTGKVSPSTETNEVFSANTNNENTIGDEIMMDTTERGMASPCEKMEADFVEMGQAKKFDRPVVIEDCDTLPQTMDSDESAKPALRFFEDRGFKVRVIMRVNKPWFVAKDVAACIEHSNVTKMCELCRDKDKVTITNSDEIEAINESLISQQMFSKNTSNITLISESGLYRVLAKCNLPKCEPFESWVFDEVLPSIRETGSYSVQPQPQFVLPKTLPEALRAYAAEVEAHEETKRALESESTEHKHDNCVRNGRAGGLTKNRNFHQARADAAEAKNEEQAKTIDELKERLRDELEDWKTARDFCEPTRFSFYDDKLKYRISDDLVRVSAILHITWRRGEYSRQFRKQAFDVLLHHFCCDPTYLKEWRDDWHENMYKYGALSRECGDKLEDTPDILEGLV